eukprot:2309871-Pyramimonas_sp.AAC.1
MLPLQLLYLHHELARQVDYVLLATVKLRLGGRQRAQERDLLSRRRLIHSARHEVRVSVPFVHPPVAYLVQLQMLARLLYACRWV